MKRNVAMALALASALCLGAAAQKQLKPWGEWTKKDAEKILNDSGWGQTQVETDTGEMFFQPTAPGSGGRRADDGATNQSVNVTYRVRFFSARPVRMALARLTELENKLEPQQAEGLKKWAQQESKDSIIVTVAFESKDQRYSGRLMQVFNSSETGVVKNDTYLQRSDGKRVFLEEYVKPGRDGFGARFVFPRVVDGQPFITPDTKEVRFHGEWAIGGRSGVRIDRRFKVADMMYEGQLEY